MTPRGLSVNDNEYFDSDIRKDDKFFHITCHVEPNLVAKISRGEFVELDKLLPRSKGTVLSSHEPKTEFVFREGRPVFLAYVDKNKTINGVRKWEQAFRVYAAIYSQANPHRSAEIWQYVFTINSAAAAYAWNNVAEYDFALRQMMGKNPKRSWSKIYTQMWNLCLTEANPKQNQFNNRTPQPGFQASAEKHTTQYSKGNGQKSDYCWRYNKNGKCKFGANCRYINKCSYCDGASHELFNCPKKSELTSAANMVNSN